MIDLAYGPLPRVRFELEDGTIHRSDGLLSDLDVPTGVIRALQELPAPSLKGQSFRELDLDSRFEVSQRILEVALLEADIVLWCTTEFQDLEHSLWSSLPDEIKDHSFLVVTKADRKIMRGTLADTISRLEPIVSEEFLGLYPVASLQGISARVSRAQTDQHLWKSSGGQSLAHAIRHQVNSGRAADIDSAQMVLTKLGGDAARPSRQERKAREVPSVFAPTAEPAPAPAKPAVDNTRPKAAADILSQAVRVLSQSGQDLLRELDGDASLDTDAILAQCADSIATVSSQLSEAGSVAPDLKDAATNAQDGEEMMILLRLERGEEAALDAVTLLLQMRKELVTKATA